jgi:hypothetical protein
MIDAQNNSTLTEAEFWSLVRQTNDVLQNPAAGDSKLDTLHDLWTGIKTVSREDGSTTPVNMDWLVAGLAERDASTLQTLQQRVQALLDYRVSQGGFEAGSSLDTLDQVLQDRRFQYADATPTPIPPPPPQPDDIQLPDLPQGSFDFSQIILIVGGIILVVILFAYFARGLQIQGRAIDETLDPGDDPETSTQAQELAANSEDAQDYRNAVRYLYLSSMLMLDERGLLHYDRTLTNREHLRQIAGKPQLTEALSPVVETFDAVWYGFAALNEATYQQYRQNVERLRGLAR